MPKFRETLWFKKGLLDALAADLLLPIEDRYIDDGSVTPADIEELSLNTPAISPSTPQTTR